MHKPRTLWPTSAWGFKKAFCRFGSAPAPRANIREGFPRVSQRAYPVTLPAWVGVRGKWDFSIPLQSRPDSAILSRVRRRRARLCRQARRLQRPFFYMLICVPILHRNAAACFWSWRNTAGVCRNGLLYCRRSVSLASLTHHSSGTGYCDGGVGLALLMPCTYAAWGVDLLLPDPRASTPRPPPGVEGFHLSRAKDDNGAFIHCRGPSSKGWPSITDRLGSLRSCLWLATIGTLASTHHFAEPVRQAIE